jgi:hypothetical protein
MRTFRQFAQFVHPGGATTVRALQAHLFGDFPVPSISVRSMVQQFEGLPAPFDFTLDVKPTGGTAPLHVDTRYGPFVGVRIAGLPLNSGFRVLQNGQVIRVANSETGFAHRFDNPGTFVIEGAAEGVGSNGYARVVRTRTVTVQGTTTPPPTPAKPVISVQAKGDGSFAVTGSKFLPSTTVHIRVVDDALTTRFFDQGSNPDGTVQFTTPKICVFPGRLHFSANDGRSDPHDLTGTLWSNTVDTTCG